MGYTHYFKFKDHKNIDKDKFAVASGIANCFYNKIKGFVDIAGGDGTGTPVFNENEVYFNGAGEDGCETFYIDREGKFMEFCFGKAFCKTCRNPYDILVCLTLLAFKFAFGDDFTYTSDGNTREDSEKNGRPIESEWKDAYEYWDASPWGKNK